MSLQPRSSQTFVTTSFTQEIVERAAGYLNAGFPVHFQGATGSGKTTLALHISQLMNNPTTLIYGDDEFGSSDLVGHDRGYNRRKVVDNYIHSVLKVEESMNNQWVDNRLTLACREGHTLIYDEFTRSRPEANNVLLSVLAERILVLPTHRGQSGYIRVHPNFRLIFTSNPEEYIGTHSSQDALLDRMITIKMPEMDYETAIAIAQAHSDVPHELAEHIVFLVDAVRKQGLLTQAPSVRAAIMICSILGRSFNTIEFDNPLFVKICCDVLKLQTPDQVSSLQDIIAEVAG